MKPLTKIKGLNIPLFEGWILRSDVNNIILARVENNREQEQYFYSSIQASLEAFIEKRIKRLDCTSIAELLEALKLLQARLNTALTPLNLEVVNTSKAEFDIRKGRKQALNGISEPINSGHQKELI